MDVPTSNNPPAELRPYGLDAGKFVVPDDFNDPLPDDILEAFFGPIFPQTPSSDSTAR